MPRSKRFGLRGLSRERKFPLLLAFTILITISGTSSHGADDPGECSPVIGRVVSLQGTIAIRREGAPSWLPVTRLDTAVCAGDRLRAGAGSRAALFIQPENIIRVDQNTEISLSHTTEETFIEFFQELTAIAVDAATQGCGAGYVVTRFPKRFRIRTPHLNAAVEGTEFLVAMRCETTELAVFEGKVRAQAVGSPDPLLLSARQSVIADPNQPAQIRLLVKPEDAVQWALYYPPLFDAGLPVPTADQCAQLPDGAMLQTCFAQRAEAFLGVGRVDAAEREIAQALADPNPNADALAIKSVIAVAKNDKAGALVAANQAIAIDADSARAWLALSYAQQAQFKLDEATESVKKATELAPGSSLAQARLAELLMSSGRIRDAEKAAKRAVEIAPQEARAHMVMGFVYLAKIDTQRARESFTTAIGLNSTEPLSRLGFGLAEIREGRLKDGREQLEIAAALDPRNSLLRSYLGKAYYEENTRARDQLAETQFDLAKSLDPNDPTPWFYESVLLRNQNRPVHALESLQASVKRNDTRAVYRSRLLLDKDTAARNVSIAHTYRSLDFDRLGFNVAARSLEDDPANYSAHRFLSDMYAELPRHEIARSSELLQSKLLQPISTTYQQPCSAGDVDAFSRRPILLDLGYAEYSELFESNGTNFLASGAFGDHDKRDFDGQLSILQNNVAAGIAACHRSDTGFRENQDYRRTLTSGFVQASATRQLDLQVELISDDRSFGDITLNFDPTIFSPIAQNEVSLKSRRFGAHYQADNQSHAALSVIDADRTNTFFDGLPGVFDLNREVTLDSTQVEALATGSIGNTVVTAGAGAGRVESTDRDHFRDFVTPFEFSSSTDRVSEQYQIYAYATSPIGKGLSITTGVSFDSLRDEPVNQDRLNPKIGVRWTLGPSVSVRAAAFRSARRFLVQNQTLEPTNIAGFNQFFDDFSGARTERYGLGVDAQPLRNWFLGAEVSQRRLSVPVLSITPAGQEWVFEAVEERLATAYLYATLHRQLSMAIEPSVDKFVRNDQLASDTLPREIETVQLPITLKFNVSSGLSLAASARYLRQKVQRLPAFEPLFASGVESAVLWDSGIAYRLPGRKLILSLDARNLTDEELRYQDDNFLRRSELGPSGVYLERSIWARLTVQM